MQDDELKAFSADLMALGVTYEKELSKIQLRIYWDALHDLSLQEFRTAIGKHLRDPKAGAFFPKPADIVRHTAMGSREDAGLVAWSVVERAVAHVGCYQSVVFEDGVTGAVVSDLGGWVRLCLTSDEDWPFLKVDFCKRYLGYLARGEHVKLVRLIGKTEQAFHAGTNFDPRFPDGLAPAMLVGRDKRIAPFQLPAGPNRKQIPVAIEEPVTAT